MNSVKLQDTKWIYKNISCIFSCISVHKLSEREVKNTVPFAIVSKRIKYLGISLTKEVKDLYTENCKILMKKLGKTQINKKISYVHGLEKLILLKCPYYPKQSTDSMQSLSKFHWHFSQKQKKNKILKFVWKHKRPQLAKATLRK